MARAVGSVAEVLEYALPLVKVEGRVLAMKGQAAEHELAEASDALSVLGAGDVQVFEAYPDLTGEDANDPAARELLIISIVKDRPTPKLYPRRPGLPRHEPL